MPAFEAVKQDYAARWAAMQIRPERVADVQAVARKALTGKARYETVSGQTGVPWFVVGVIHQMECGGNWRGCLANGDPWNQRTTHVPRGFGPWTSWEDAAVWALRYDGLDKTRQWSPEMLAYCLEKYNGFGSRAHGVPSAYLWSFTNQHERGKFVSDGVWNAMAVSGQPGGMAIMRSMMDLDPSISFADELQMAASEYPRTFRMVAADLDQEDHGAAHDNLKQDSPWYWASNWLRKALGLPAGIAAAGGVSASEMEIDPMSAISAFGSFASQYGVPLLLLSIVAIVTIELTMFSARTKELT